MKAIEVMQRQVVTVTSEASIADAVRLMIYHRIGSLPVLEPWPSISGVPLWNRLGDHPSGPRRVEPTSA